MASSSSGPVSTGGSTILYGASGGISGGSASLIVQLADKLQETAESIDQLCSCLIFDPAHSATHARELLGIAQKLKDGLFYEKSLATRKEREIPYPLTYRLFQLLTRQEIQFYEEMKQPLASVLRIFLELTVFHCHDQKKRMYESSALELRGRIKEIRATLPKGEVLTYFELSCVSTALRKLSVGLGGAKQLASKHASPLGTALLEIALSPSAAPPFVSLAPLAAPLVGLARDIFNSLEKSWYQPIWVCRWLAMEGHLKQVGDFQAIQSYMSEWKNNHKLAFYISLLFKKIIDNEEAAPALKSLVLTGSTGSTQSFSSSSSSSTEVIVESEVNLLALAIFRKRRIKAGRELFWRVRYQTLEHLSQIIPLLEKDSLRDRLRNCLTAPLDHSNKKREHACIVDHIPDWVRNIAFANRDDLLDIRADFQADVEKRRQSWSSVDTVLQEERLLAFQKVTARLGEELEVTAELTFAEAESAVSTPGGAKLQSGSGSVRPSPSAEEMRNLEEKLAKLKEIEGELRTILNRDGAEEEKMGAEGMLKQTLLTQADSEVELEALKQQQNKTLDEIGEMPWSVSTSSSGGVLQSGSSSRSKRRPRHLNHHEAQLHLKSQIARKEIEKIRADQRVLNAISRIEEIMKEI